MSGVPSLRDPLDIQDIVARIARAPAETDKVAAEQRKLTAEADKLSRDRGLASWLPAFVILGSVGGLVAGVATLLRLESP